MRFNALSGLVLSLNAVAERVLTSLYLRWVPLALSSGYEHVSHEASVSHLASLVCYGRQVGGYTHFCMRWLLIFFNFLLPSGSVMNI